MTKVCYNDPHIGSRQQTWSKQDFLVLLAKDSAMYGEENLHLNGDIVDSKNWDAKNLNEMYDFLAYLKHRFGDRYIFGNHEYVTGLPSNDYFIDDLGNIHRHLHLELWGREKAESWISSHHPGAGWLGRLLALELDELRFLAPIDPVNSAFKLNCLSTLREISAVHPEERLSGLIVGGHKHPKKRIDVQYVEGGTAIIFPRGRNLLEKP